MGLPAKVPHYRAVLKVASDETIRGDACGFRIKAFRNSGQSFKFWGNFAIAGTNVITENQMDVYEYSQSLNWFFRSECGILIQLQFNVIGWVLR